jgi:hypothetical protein
MAGIKTNLVVGWLLLDSSLTKYKILKKLLLTFTALGYLTY